MSQLKPSMQELPVVEILPPQAAENVGLVDRLTAIVNAAYKETEDGIFLDENQRTDAAEIQDFIRKGEIAISRITNKDATLGTEVIGCVRIQRLSATHGEFGLLALDAQHRGGGRGSELIRFAEDHCRSQGLNMMQVELLYPRDYEHVFKKRLSDWYIRLGYDLVRLGSFQDEWPQFYAQLRHPCDFRVFEKAL